MIKVFEEFIFNDEKSYCIDCGKEIPLGTNDRYMINDELWKRNVGCIYAGEICMDCLEKRVGRKLNRKDFHQYREAPINTYNKKISNMEKINI